MPVALTVPKYMGGDRESRLATSIRRQKTPKYMPDEVPQGICVVSPGGKVLEWIHGFEREEDFLAFLDRTRKACEIDAAPEVHAKSEICPAGPRPQRGSLRGMIYGRALTREGKLCEDVDRQGRYMQEKFALPRPQAASLIEERIPREVVEALLREAYLGQKDVALLGNPLGVKPDVRKLAFRSSKGEGGRFRIEGESHLVGAGGPGFRHEMELTWEGVVETDREGVLSLVLIGRGRYALRWRGFENDADRFRGLMGGRSIDEASEVKFAVVLKRCDGGTEDLPTGGPPETLPPKMERLRKALRRSGGPTQELRAEMEKLGALVERRAWAEAERQLDKILELIGD